MPACLGRAVRGVLIIWATRRPLRRHREARTRKSSPTATCPKYPLCVTFQLRRNPIRGQSHPGKHAERRPCNLGGIPLHGDRTIPSQCTAFGWNSSGSGGPPGIRAAWRHNGDSSLAQTAQNDVPKQPSRHGARIMWPRTSSVISARGKRQGFPAVGSRRERW